MVDPCAFALQKLHSPRRAHSPECEGEATSTSLAAPAQRNYDGNNRTDAGPDTAREAPPNTRRGALLSGPSPMVCYAMRLQPGDEVYTSLKKAVAEKNLRAACIVTCVGSVSEAVIRLANADKENPNPTLKVEERCEVVSLVGTLSQQGVHLHVSLADKHGRVLAGHLLEGMKVFTTMEIVIGECTALHFSRNHDNRTGFKELSVQERTTL